MRLSDHALFSYALRYERPVRWSDVTEHAAPLVLLRLRSDTGAVGVAEITPKPTWCGATARSVAAAIEDIFIPIIKRLDLSDVPAVRRALDGVPDNAAAKVLIDNACWDLNAAAAGRALWGGRERIELSWALTRQAPHLMAREAADMIAAYGFRTLKVKGGQGVDVDRAVMREVRAAIGDDVRLYVDANGAYGVAEAADYARTMADGGAVMVEDPCAFVPDARFRDLQAQAPVPLLVDFGCTSLRDAALFIEQGARALSVKPGRFGLTVARDMSRLADAAGCASIVGLIVGLMGESALGSLAGLQFACSLKASPLPAELSWFLAMQEQIVTAVPKVADGNLELPPATSMASLVDWDAVQRCATAMPR